tara:strand:- start:176 stop:400 length:225 start_codon:yes stop_codon:yes gene_type:complete
MKDKIYIDNSEFMELVSELATQITEKSFGEDTYKQTLSGDIVFWEDAQDYFNDKYTEFEMMFNKIANIYSDEKQ